MKILDIDGPLMQTMGKIADLMWLNILTLVFSLPIVTAGAALTALHYMALKIVRNEECYITKEYFRAFKQNFRQATLIWLLFLVVAGLLAGDFYIFRESGEKFSGTMQLVILFLTVVTVFTLMFVFPVQAKFENTLLRTIKNAFFISVVQFPKTILMIVLFAIPPVLFVFFPQVIPLVFLLGLSVPAWLSAKLYNKFFQKLEGQMDENAPGGEEAADAADGGEGTTDAADGGEGTTDAAGGGDEMTDTADAAEKTDIAAGAESDDETQPHIVVDSAQER